MLCLGDMQHGISGGEIITVYQTLAGNTSHDAPRRFGLDSTTLRRLLVGTVMPKVIGVLCDPAT